MFGPSAHSLTRRGQRVRDRLRVVYSARRSVLSRGWRSGLCQVFPDAPASSTAHRWAHRDVRRFPGQTRRGGRWCSCSKITAVSVAPLAEPALPDDDDPALHAGHVNVLADELARLFGPTPQAVREHAAEAALEVVNRHLRQEQQSGGG